MVLITEVARSPRIKFLIFGSLIAAALILFLSSNDAVHSHPAFDKVKVPWGQQKHQPPPPPFEGEIGHHGPPPPFEGEAGDHELAPHLPPTSDPTMPDATEYLSLDDATQFCDFRRFKPWPNRDKKRKIYDLILVNRELEWLEIRLGQMYSHVDYFVVVESPKTFTDGPKDLFVEKNWDRFAKYHDKMIRHTITEEGQKFGGTWEREAFSRNAMVNQVLPFLEGEKKIDLDDVIIIADVDEIPRPATLTALRNCEIPDALTLRSRMYYYSFQWMCRLSEEWPHPQAMLWKGSDTRAAEELRMGWPNQQNMFNAAWHCSYCFSSLDEMVNKVTSFSHTEFNKPEFRDPEKILKRVRSGLDFFDRDDSHFDRIDNNPDVPSFLQQNSEKYAFALNRDPANGNFKDSAE